MGDYVSSASVRWWTEREARRGVDGVVWQWPVAGSCTAATAARPPRSVRAAGGRPPRAMRIRHTHKALDEALTAARTVMAASIEAAHQIHRWEQVMLTSGEQVCFASEASSLWTGKIPPADLLMVRRPDDAGDDLWRVFNRVQENLTVGGIVGRTATGRQTRTRGIRAVDSSVRVNGALWALAERFAA